MLKVLFCGDTLIQSSDGTDPFVFMHSIFAKHDVIVFNLETTLIGNHEGLNSPKKAVVFFTDPRNLEFLSKHKSKIIFSLSNNHILDYGEDGYNQTCSAIKKWGGRILGLNEQKTFKFNEYNLTFISYFRDFQKQYKHSSFFVNGSLKVPKNNQSTEKKPFIIVCVHWGLEHILIPSPNQQDLADQWLKWGARIVVGHHSHSAQALEKRKQGIVAYSLGNFNMRNSIIYSDWGVSKLSYMLSLELTKKNEEIYINSLITIPYIIDINWRPSTLRGISAEQFSTYFNQLTNLLKLTKGQSFNNWINYYLHISRPHLLNNFTGGWMPRFRRYGIRKQLWPFLKWLLNKDTFFSLFLFCFTKFDPARQIKPDLNKLLTSFSKKKKKKK